MEHYSSGIHLLKGELIMIQNLHTSDMQLLLKEHYVGHLSYISGNQPHIIPITYFYDPIENVLLSYSGMGHKIKNMRKHPNVSLLVDVVDSISKWKSVQISGTYEELHGTYAKSRLHDFARGVSHLVEVHEGLITESLSEFSHGESNVDGSIVYQIKIHEWMGKEQL
ncbi:Nitroimidazol reductase NimA, pyridoxamine 5'-phosphate oxidase superfamily [Pustulibacterium marinum]|uniref:Nitroimidazol reductase NimA, pyridoxamine 5'-phosphate oxidase superfamily n=1 Tax=Pustulibacterium marinum TaxID=1224947 RepID=A0A1I7GB78_9FLAO|nr:pyridoxamine 5'-phosphate oxidase family protein [Pustulibacterium marinum]SFU45693.1 Nitroimidazol reductase NimA, pyridoxamine 5'-phosphate oxidase superfamily [Pustulibacterium marinum]